jgi:hypothetical protein
MGTFNYNPGNPPTTNGYFIISLSSPSTQTKTSNAKFTYSDPISITFGS